MSNFILWIILVFLNKNVFVKGKENIVLHGGNHCSGGNALIYEHGKGKKKENIIINDNNLIMKDGESDGNIIMDGHNLIFKEGKKHENIIIKGGGGGHCHEEHHEDHETHPMHVHIKPTHTKEHKVYVPVHHKKKVIHHHHHKKEIHHNDHWNSKSRKDDSMEEEEIEPREEKRIIRKLKLGDKLSSEEKERLKFKKVDKRFGLSGLAGRMMKKIKWKKGTKSSKVKNNYDKKEEINKEENQEINEQQNEQQNEEEEDDNTNSKDQEDDVGSNNPTLYDNPISFSSLYPGINPISGGYMAPGYNTMFLNPYQSELPKLTENDLNKKSKKQNTKLNSEEIRQSSDEEYEDVVDEADKTKKPRNKIDNLSLPINLTNQEKKLSSIPQPVFTIDENQLGPAIYSILTLANNLKKTSLTQPLSTSIKSLPLYTPNKSSLDNSDVSLLLPIISHQSKKQLQLIKKQQEKIILQQAENEALSKKLQQAKLINLSKKKWLEEDINLEEKNFKNNPNDFDLKEKDDFENYDENLNELLLAKLKNNEKIKNLNANKLNRRTTMFNKKDYIISSYDYNKNLKDEKFSDDEFEDNFLNRKNRITKRMSINNKFLFNKQNLNKKNINKVQLDKNATLLIYNL